MYEKYWGLDCKPFENIVDTKFFYRSAEHEETLMRMLYSVKENRGCGVITGTYGAGKTFIMYTLMQEIEKLGRKSIIIPNPAFHSIEILKEIAYRLRIQTSPQQDKAELLHILEDNFLSYARNNKNVVIIVDEAHTIDDKRVLDDLRMLLNLTHNGKFLVTLIFSGQPEFEDNMRNTPQLEQRVALKASLKGLSKEETADYINFRLKVAGAGRKIFDTEAIELIWSHSNGIPRVINNICDIALLFGFHKELELVDKKTVNEAYYSMKGTSVPSEIVQPIEPAPHQIVQAVPQEEVRPQVVREVRREEVRPQVESPKVEPSQKANLFQGGATQISNFEFRISNSVPHVAVKDEFKLEDFERYLLIKR